MKKYEIFLLNTTNCYCTTIHYIAHYLYSLIFIGVQVYLETCLVEI